MVPCKSSRAGSVYVSIVRSMLRFLTGVYTVDLRVKTGLIGRG